MDKHIKLDSFGSDYEPTDSEAEYSEEEKQLLKDYRESRRKDVDAKKQVLAFADSSDDEEDDEEEEEDEQQAADDDDLMHDSDIEGAKQNDELPDDKNWGGKAKDYYNTDFVDPDYSSYTAKEEELAQLEEEEAKNIQTRLLKAMKEDDFLLNDDMQLPIAAKAATAADETVISIQTDLSQLPLSEKDKLFKKDSPEFVGLMLDYKELLEDVRLLIAPVLRYARQQKVPKIPALQFAELYQNLALTYCSNISFYLLLKAKRIAIRNHPVTKRLLQLKKLLQQLKDKYENIIRPQLEALLERIENGDYFEVLDVTAKKAKKKLAVLAEYEMEQPETKRVKFDGNESDEQSAHNDNDSSSNDEADNNAVDDAEENEEEQNAQDVDARRGINYQIAKNKGLTPHRKKELRNPRVKHRSKFRKALIRRKGAVRIVRKETMRYGGEMSGIKAGVSKSVKFKV